MDKKTECPTVDKQEIEVSIIDRYRSKISLKMIAYRRKRGNFALEDLYRKFNPAVMDSPDTWEIQVDPKSLVYWHKTYDSTLEIGKLHLHVGRDSKVYICYPARIAFEEMVKEVIENWVLATRFQLTCNVDANYLESLVVFARRNDGIPEDCLHNWIASLKNSEMTTLQCLDHLELVLWLGCLLPALHELILFARKSEEKNLFTLYSSWIKEYWRIGIEFS